MTIKMFTYNYYMFCYILVRVKLPRDYCILCVELLGGKLSMHNVYCFYVVAIQCGFPSILTMSV